MQRRRDGKTKPPFPYNVLVALVNGGLDDLERYVGRFVSWSLTRLFFKSGRDRFSNRTKHKR